MPGYFLNGGLGQLDAREAIDGVSEFISKVLGWCEGIADPRVDQLRADWSAITNADKDGGPVGAQGGTGREISR
jgi:hypothetical protein